MQDFPFLTQVSHRYLTAAVVLSINSRKRKTIERDIVKVIEQEEYAYQDPITEFILWQVHLKISIFYFVLELLKAYTCIYTKNLFSLYVKFDFKKAQDYLAECETVLANDFFLRNYTKEFIENARQIIFETFCRIHQCIR